MKLLWRVICRRTYVHDMARLREPEPRPFNADEYVGLWVAVKGGVVVAVAGNSRDLVPALRKLGPSGEGAVAQYVPRPSTEIVIGVG